MATLDAEAAAIEGDVPEGSLLKYPQHRTLSLVFVLMGIMMHTIDSTIANVALPHIQGSLAATIEQITWVITGYIVAAAVATPPVAWLAERFGIKTVILVSMGAFVLSSVLCGMALSLNNLVFFRVLQGLSGAALIPIGQTIVLSAFQPKDYGKAMGLFGVGIMFGPIIGPTLGGYITEWSSWRWVFFVNLPFGLIAMAGIWYLIEDSPKVKKLSFDGIGFTALVLAMASFQLLMDRGHGEDWFESWEIISWAAIAVSALYIFVIRTITAAKPFFDRRLFTDRNFAVGNVVFFFVGGNMVVAMMMIPVVMQTLLGYPVNTAGFLLAARGLGMMLAMSLMPRLFSRLDPRLVISLGLAITAYALWEQSLMSTYFAPEDFVRTGFLHGFGLGTIFVTLGAITFNHMPDDIRLQASTFFNMVRNIGQSFCAALATSALARSIQTNSAELGVSITPMAKNWQSYTAQFPALTGQADMLSMAQLSIAKQAMFISYINIFYALAVLSLCFIPVIWLARSQD